MFVLIDGFSLLNDDDDDDVVVNVVIGVVGKVWW
jgi:hypothetical protein